MRGIQVVSRSQALEQLDQSRASGGALRLGSRVVLGAATARAGASSTRLRPMSRMCQQCSKPRACFVDRQL